jgi:hypothetical protein
VSCELRAASVAHGLLPSKAASWLSLASSKYRGETA